MQLGARVAHQAHNRCRLREQAQLEGMLKRRRAKRQRPQRPRPQRLRKRGDGNAHAAIGNDPIEAELGGVEQGPHLLPAATRMQQHAALSA